MSSDKLKLGFIRIGCLKNYGILASLEKISAGQEEISFLLREGKVEFYPNLHIVSKLQARQWICTAGQLVCPKPHCALVVSDSILGDGEDGCIRGHKNRET